MMSALHTIGVLVFALTVGCAGRVTEAPPSVMAQPGPALVDPPLAEPDQDATIAAAPPRPRAKEAATAALAPPLPPSKSRSAAAAPSPAKAPTRVSASVPSTEQPRKNESPPRTATKPEPSLDVQALTARLRDTNAIGVFTKLALKNQLDDLVKKFRAHHQSGQKAGIASLRQPYDMLVLKVLAAVQDGDPSLAGTISGSREAIWGILADPEKFSSVT